MEKKTRGEQKEENRVKEKNLKTEIPFNFYIVYYKDSHWREKYASVSLILISWIQA